MANQDNPHGLRPLMRTLGGGVPDVRTLSKVVGYGVALFQWDVVHRVTDGSIEAFASATPGTTLSSGVALNWAAASVASDHLVMVAPTAVFEAQDNNDTDGIAAADLGLNVNVEANAGSATTHVSGHELDESTANVSAARDLHMLSLLAVPDNAHTAWARIEVVFNLHRMASASVGV